MLKLGNEIFDAPDDVGFGDELASAVLMKED